MLKQQVEGIYVKSVAYWPKPSPRFEPRSHFIEQLAGVLSKGDDEEGQGSGFNRCWEMQGIVFILFKSLSFFFFSSNDFNTIFWISEYFRGKLPSSPQHSQSRRQGKVPTLTKSNKKKYSMSWCKIATWLLFLDEFWYMWTVIFSSL